MSSISYVLCSHPIVPSSRKHCFGLKIRYNLFSPPVSNWSRLRRSWADLLRIRKVRVELFSVSRCRPANRFPCCRAILPAACDLERPERRCHDIFFEGEPRNFGISTLADFAQLSFSFKKQESRWVGVPLRSRRWRHHDGRTLLVEGALCPCQDCLVVRELMTVCSAQSRCYGCRDRHVSSRSCQNSIASTVASSCVWWFLNSLIFLEILKTLTFYAQARDQECSIWLENLSCHWVQIYRKFDLMLVWSVNLFSVLFKQEGARGLYRGLLPTLAGVIPSR